LHLRLLLPQEASLLELQYWVSWTKICRRARTDEQTASVRKMPTTFPSSAPASQPVIELARERRAHYGAGAALIRTAIIHSFNASSRNEWEYRMASNNNNNKSTILLTHTETDRPLSPAQSENTNTESATRRSCAFARQGQKLRPLMRREGQAGRQGAREGGRESSERGGSGDQWGPAEVGSQVSCPATIVLFVPCVCACGQYYYPMSFAQNLSPAPTHEWSANKLVCTHPRNFLFKFLRQKQNCWGENSLQTHTHPPSFQWVSTKLTSRAGWFCSTK
jgi:hypothetical protein